MRKNLCFFEAYDDVAAAGQLVQKMPFLYEQGYRLLALEGVAQGSTVDRIKALIESDISSTVTLLTRLGEALGKSKEMVEFIGECGFAPDSRDCAYSKDFINQIEARFKSNFALDMIFAKMQNDIEAVLGYIAQSVVGRVKLQLVLQAQTLGMTIVGIDHSCVEQLPESMFTTPDDVIDATMRQRERLFIETLTGLEAVNGKRAIMLMGYGHNAIFQPKTGLGRITELVFLYSRDLKGKHRELYPCRQSIKEIDVSRREWRREFDGVVELASGRALRELFVVRHYKGVRAQNEELPPGSPKPAVLPHKK